MKKIDEIIQGMQQANLPSDYWLTPCVKFPELDAVQIIMQRNGQSVWDHTMSVIDLLTIKNPVTLLSGLFHDLGKGRVVPLGDISISRFPGHDDESAKIAEVRLKKWGATTYLIDRVKRLVSTHMFDLSNAMREKTIRKFVADVGLDNLDNWFVVRVADSRSYAAQQRYRNHFIEPFRRAINAYILQQPSLGQPEFNRHNDSGVIQIRGGDSK